MEVLSQGLDLTQLAVGKIHFARVNCAQRLGIKLPDQMNPVGRAKSATPVNIWVSGAGFANGLRLVGLSFDVQA